jgi:hypothetical protein
MVGHGLQSLPMERGISPVARFIVRIAAGFDCIEELVEANLAHGMLNESRA